MNSYENKKYFKIGIYKYNSKINFYWFKNIDKYFSIISDNLDRFSDI